MDKLNQIIAIAGQSAKALKALGLSGTPISIVVSAVKFFTKLYNDNRASADAELLLPPDNELIQRVRDVSTRGEATGLGFLDGTDSDD